MRTYFSESTGDELYTLSGNFSRVAVMKAAAEAGLNYKALRLGDKHGNRRPAVGKSNPITPHRLGRLIQITEKRMVEECEAGKVAGTHNGAELSSMCSAELSRELTRLIPIWTDGRWTFADYVQPTVTGATLEQTAKAARREAHRAAVSAPSKIESKVVAFAAKAMDAHLAAPKATEPETEEGTEEVEMTEPAEVVSPGSLELETALRNSRGEVARLRMALASAGGGLAAHPLEGIRIPAAELAAELADYIAPPELVQMVARIHATSGSNPRRIRRLFDFAGPAGGGKSIGAKWVAVQLGWSVVKIDCGLVEDSGKGFLVEQGTANGTLTETPSRFAKAVATADTVIILDEVARAPMTAQNGLLPLYDSGMAAEFSLTTGEEIRIERHPQTVTIMARNEGREYVGSGSIDAALLNRAEKISIVPPSPLAVRQLLIGSGCPAESAAKLVAVYTMVQIAKAGQLSFLPVAVRELATEVARIPAESVSLRGLKSVGQSIAAGVNEEEAFTVGLYRHMAVNSRKGDPVAVIAAQVGHKPTSGQWSRSQIRTGMAAATTATTLTGGK